MNPTRDLKSLVKELALNQKRASVDLEAIPWQTRASIQNMKMDAVEKVSKLKEEYFRKVRSNTFGLFLFGDTDRVETFTSIAAEEAGVLTVKGDAIYQTLAAKIEPSLSNGREFGPTQLQGLIEGLRDLNMEMGIRTMQMPKLAEMSVINNRTQMVGYIRKLVQNVVGDDLLRMNVDQKINQAAVDTEFAGKLLPVAVTGLDREEIAALASLFTNAVTVEVGTSEDGAVDQKYVLNQLESLKSKLKGKTN